MPLRYALDFHESLLRHVTKDLPKQVQKFIGHRFKELKSNIKTKFDRFEELGEGLNVNKELRAYHLEQGSSPAPWAQVGTVSPMRLLPKEKPKHWNATTAQWDRADPRCNGPDAALTAFIAETAEKAVFVECSESVVCMCEHYIAEEDIAIEKKLEDASTQA